MNDDSPQPPTVKPWVPPTQKRPGNTSMRDRAAIRDVGQWWLIHRPLGALDTAIGWGWGG